MKGLYFKDVSRSTVSKQVPNEKVRETVREGRRSPPHNHFKNQSTPHCPITPTLCYDNYCALIRTPHPISHNGVLLFPYNKGPERIDRMVQHPAPKEEITDDYQEVSCHADRHPAH